MINILGFINKTNKNAVAIGNTTLFSLISVIVTTFGIKDEHILINIYCIIVCLYG